VHRGEPGVDRAAVRDALVRFAALAEALPRLIEFDVPPSGPSPAWAGRSSWMRGLGWVRPDRPGVRSRDGHRAGRATLHGADASPELGRDDRTAQAVVRAGVETPNALLDFAVQEDDRRGPDAHGPCVSEGSELAAAWSDVEEDEVV